MRSFARPIAISIMLGAAMLASPPAATAADTSPQAMPAQAATPAGATAAPAPEATRETVEQRITTLHASLKITPDEEMKWNSVTKAMRDNAAAMDRLVAARSARDPASVTAVDDLKTYATFAQAHVKGLKTLTTSFESLYRTMPDAQKKVADEVFSSFGRHEPASHG